MQDIVAKTIDKTAFKVNLPILISIIIGTITLYGAFASLKTQVQLLSAKFDLNYISIAADIKNLKDNDIAQSLSIYDLDKRVSKIDGK